MPRLKREIRNFEPNDNYSFRAFEEDGKRYIEGYAAVFNHRSKLIAEFNRLFYEYIEPNAFDEVLRDESLDVILNFNHNRDRVMARTKSNTLKLATDEKGLYFRAEVPNVSYANDVYELISRGDLFENSFAFMVRKTGERWDKDAEGNDTRYITNVARLLDVSVVVNGAYSETDVYAREEDLEETIDEVVKETEDAIAEVEESLANLPEEENSQKISKAERLAKIKNELSFELISMRTQLAKLKK